MSQSDMTEDDYDHWQKLMRTMTISTVIGQKQEIENAIRLYSIPYTLQSVYTIQRQEEQHDNEQ